MPPPLLLSCESIAKQYGPRPLFEKLSFGFYEGDRVGLVGPNGAGKSTFLRILAGLEDADVGTLAQKKGLRVGYLAQDPTFSDGATVESAMLEALGDLPLEEFEKSTRVGLALGRLGFRDFDQPVEILSGGWKKRLGLARELAREPDVLLLDEPTNHLDLDGILELEELLQNAPFAFIAASHDRYFLESVAKRMLELDRNDPEGLLQVDGNYSALLEKRDEVRRNQAEYQEVLANRARREVEWLRRGPKARTTKSKSRIDRAHQLLDELAAVKERTVEATAGIDLASSGRKTKRLLVAEGISKSYGDRTLFEGLDLLLRPGTRLGLLGANGSGKSTLLSILAGTLEPDSGTVERAQFLNTVLFEQSRETLDRTVSLRRALAPEGDSVIYQGRPIHVAPWAKRFLFRMEQLDTPVSRLSGGEQARILIARLMLRPADLLILDEPTNDLDIPTLEVLEESLLEFPGALVLVTHDRYLLDRVSTEILALDGAGNVESFADTAQWAARDRTPKPPKRPAGKSQPPAASTPAPAAPKPAKRKLTYSEQKELAGMEAAILKAEEALGRAQAATEELGIQTDATELHKRYEALDLARREVERLYGRWGELDGACQ